MPWRHYDPRYPYRGPWAGGYGWPTPGGVPPPPGAPGNPYGAPQGPPYGAPWWAGMAPAQPLPGQEGAPQGPGPGQEGAGPDWSTAQAPRPTVDGWMPPADELTRWGVERELRALTGAAAFEEVELTRITLPLPGGVQCLVWAVQLEGAGAPFVQVQVRVGIGTIQVPITTWQNVTTLDGVARILAPETNGAAPVLVPRFPAKWCSVLARLNQGPAGADTRFTVGAMIAPVTGWF